MMHVQVKHKAESNWKWNFVVNTFDAFFHGVSINLIAADTILPLYVLHLGGGPVLVGLVAAITSSAYLLPQLFAANHIEGRSKNKDIVVRAGFFLERLPFLLMALSTLVFAGQPALALLVFFLLLAWQGLGEGIVVIAWQDMLAKLFPVNRRGLFFGVSGFFETLAAVLSASFATIVLGWIDFPTNFTYLFTFAFVSICVALSFVALTREPETPRKSSLPSGLEYLRNLPAVVRSDVHFRRFLVSRALFGLGRMGVGFVTVYAISRWSLPDVAAGQLALVLLLSKLVAYVMFGFTADRLGHRLNLMIQFAALALAMVLASVSTGPTLLYISMALIGLDEALETLSAQVIVFEFTDELHRPTYIGLASTTMGIFGGISPLVGGLIAQHYGFEVVFGVAAFILAPTFIWAAYAIHEPRSTHAGVRTNN